MPSDSWTLRVVARELPLRERFTIATQTWEAATSVFAVVGYGDETGVGEAQPAEHWGESVESVVADLQAVDLGRLDGPFDLEASAALLPSGSARCALDIALHDLAARSADLRLRDLLGLGDSPLPPTSVTVPIAPVEQMTERARALADHPVLKMKLGFDGDVEAVQAVRAVYPGRIRVDANEGWSPEEAVERLMALRPLDIELCEQPIPAGDVQALREVSRSSPIPIFADEDVSSAADVLQLAGAVHGVNLKLRKAGGIRETMKAAAVARAAGLGLMLGCNLESGVATSAAAQIGSLFDHLDLDGPLLLADDPFPGVSYERGVLTLPDGPGIGVSGRP